MNGTKRQELTALMGEETTEAFIVAQQIEADLQRWHELLRSAHPDIVFSGIPVITCVGDPVPEIIAPPVWHCTYCGSVNPGDRLKCWDGVNGCSASRPVEYNELPRGILHLPEVRGNYILADDLPLWLTENGRDSLRAQFGQLFLPAITRVVEAINAWIH